MKIKNRLLFIILPFILILLTYLCTQKIKNKNLELTVIEWIGKEIKLPSDIPCIIGGKDTILITHPKEYKILLYVDSTDCTSCKLKRDLDFWTEYLKKVDSSCSIDFSIYIHPKDEEEIRKLLIEKNFSHPVYFDRKDKLKKLNNLPQATELQCFLLDQYNKILIIGNPIFNSKIKDLYKKEIYTKSIQSNTISLKNEVQIENSNINLGKFHWQVQQKIEIKIKNTAIKPLIIHKIDKYCSCLNISYPTTPIHSGNQESITITYHAEKPEYINKTLLIHCNMEESPLIINLTGIAQ